MAAKVSLGFAKFSDAELDNFAQGVINRMTRNATYPTPGTMHSAQVGSLGGSTGQSDWSDPTSHMAM